MLLTALALVLIAAPGEYFDAWTRECTTEWDQQCKEFYFATHDRHYMTVRNFSPTRAHVMVQVLEHGWPRPFLARALVLKETASGRPHRVKSTPLIHFPNRFRSWGGPLDFYVSWSNYDHWPLSADEWMLHLWPLAIDLAAAFLIVILVGAAAERWIRNRRGWFQYRMADIFVAVAFIGVLLAVYTYHARIRRLEAQGATPPLPPGFVSHDGDLISNQRYFGPVWLRKLVGNEYLLPLFHHVDSVLVRHGDKRLDVYRQLPALPYLESVWADDVLPLEAIEQLARCRRLKELRLPWLDSKSAIATSSASIPLFGLGDLPLLERLHLTALRLSGDRVLAAHLERIASFPTIREIVLPDSVSATPEEIDAIRAKHPTVEIVVPHPRF